MQDYAEILIENRKHIELGEALARLNNHPDFKKVFGNYVTEELVKSLVKSLATNLSQKEGILNKLNAISAIQYIFAEITENHEKAKAALLERNLSVED